MNLTRKIIFSNSNFKLQRLFCKFYDYLDNNSNINQIKKELNKQDFDIFHPTYYSPYFLKFLKNKPLVLTVHDMIHEIYPEYFFFSNKIIKQKKKLILRADKIITVSENTKKDILHFYDVPENKIRVIYHGNSLFPNQNKSLDIPDLPKKYILFVGERGIYKNFEFFVKSISPILREDRDINIVVAGGYSGKNLFSKGEQYLFKKLNIEKQIFQYSINDQVLAYLYQNALCFVFPTLYEGFGIPVLESFACNCPAIVSNTSSLPEVGGDAVIYFDPKNNQSILSSVKKIIYDQKLREELIIKGKEQLKKFSWGKTAKETSDLYRDLLNGN